jgi:hypothetical protein
VTSNFPVSKERADKIATREAQVVASWQPWLRSHVDDLAQEARARIFVVIARDVGSFLNHPPGAQTIFLHRAARSACIDYMRKERRHHFRRVAGEPDGTTPTAEEDAIRGELREQLRDLFIIARAEMSPREREAFDWKLGVGPKPDATKWTLRTYVDRARAKLIGVAERRGLAWVGQDAYARLFVR